jgi:hypothetical protein
MTVSDRETGNRDRLTRKIDVEDTAGGVTVNSQDVSTCPIDCHALIDDQFPGGERNYARDTRGVDRIAIIRVHERLTQ